MSSPKNTITFLCHVLGLNPDQDFSFDWAPEAESRNSHLKSAILSRYSELLDVPDDTSMNFWKASDVFSTAEELLAFIEKPGANLAQSLSKLVPNKSFSKSGPFPILLGVDIGDINLIIERTKLAQHESGHLCQPFTISVLAGVGTKRPRTSNYDSALRASEKCQRDYVEASRAAPAPSDAARSSEFEKLQKQIPILNGRPTHLRSMPIGLYHPVFAAFEADLRQEQPLTSKDYHNAHNLMLACADIYPSGPSRWEVVRPTFSEALNIPLLSLLEAGALPDGTCVSLRRDKYRAYKAIFELKNEVGAGGSDPALQSSHSYRKKWSDTECNAIRGRSCCPSFLIAIAGPWMCILGAIYLEQVCVQHLTDFMWVGGGLFEEKDVHSTARVLKALQNGLRTLDIYYQTLELSLDASPDPSRFYPYPNRYRHNDQEVEFDYTGVLVPTKKAVFLGQVKNARNQDIVIKFVTRYNADAHRLLAEHGFAPKLLSISEVDANRRGLGGGLRMVVMEKARGETAYTVFGDKSLSTPIYKCVEEAIQLLHDHGWVFGDLRTPNIMVHDDRAQLIDFDWCGKHAESTYPFTLDDRPDMPWGGGVMRGGVMNKEDDIHLLTQMK